MLEVAWQYSSGEVVKVLDLKTTAIGRPTDDVAVLGFLS
jgi:hypothetical protein